MMKFKVGDKVTVMDENLSGFVTKINGNQISMVTNDGFELDFYANELLLVGEHLLFH